MTLECGDITEDIIDCAIRVHSRLGPGLLESVYEICMFHELAKKNRHVVRQVEQPVLYDGVRLDCGFRLDLLVEDQVIVEVKSVARLDAIHEAQLLTYLRLSKKPVGLLINFNSMRIRDAIVRRAMTKSQ